MLFLINQLLKNQSWLYDSLPLEKILIFHNAIILIKPVFNKNKNHYNCNMSLEKSLNQSPKNDDKK